ncbi:hypothetical protein BFJ63_vAg17312 [Fusarium oxysporum f. sp. narcissi]|uniref:Uncharacterized protein n=1 Tax=Fusarium oxysporum f. sp. narcissi TaxID=451672 RepID=A0A4Q2V032_FUSOX|nr:hypothetical protein BFJ63_vAg17312 [Fusarium oxysporum f. sp. narcissi]
MFAVAEQLQERIPDKASATMRNDLSLRSFQLRHPKLQSIAQRIQQAGLANEGEAWTLIIPPLSLGGKLPRADSIIEHIREHARNHEGCGRWEQIQEIYTQLLRICKTFEPNDPVYYMAAANAMDNFRRLSATLRAQEKQLRRGQDLNRLREAKGGLLEGLTSLDEYVVYYLAEVYELEGRPVSRDELRISSTKQDNGQAAPTFFKDSKKFSEMSPFRPPTGLVSEIRRLENIASDVFGWTPLHYAAYRGIVGTPQSGLKARVTDITEWTPLHYASESGDLSAISLLLRHGADIEMRGRDGMGPLHCAAKNGHSEAVKFLLDAGADAGIRDNSRSTPLHWAASSGDADTIKFLLMKAVDPGARDNYGRTPLHLAVTSGKVEAVDELLCNAGEDIAKAKDIDGSTTLHLAAQVQEVDISIIKHLIDGKADVQAEKNNGNQTLHAAAEFGRGSAIREPVRELDVNIQTHLSMTALHIATAFGHKRTAEELVRLGADEGAKDTLGHTPKELDDFVRGHTDYFFHGRRRQVRCHRRENSSSRDELDLLEHYTYFCVSARSFRFASNSRA